MKRLGWNNTFLLLVKYLNEHDGKFPRYNEEYENINIGEWIERQRVIHNKGSLQEDGSIKYYSNKLTKERIKKLNSINFIWNLERFDKWNCNYEILIEYLKVHNGEYPTYNSVYKNVYIGRWLQIQRAIYNNGVKEEDGSYKYGSSILTKERIDKLNRINFDWGYNNRDELEEYMWNNKYELLKEYLQEHNNEYPSSREIYKKVSLGSWINTQRVIYNNGISEKDGSIIYKSNALTKERIEKLNEIHFVWRESKETINEKKWEEKYELLKEYLKEHNGEYPKAKELYYGVDISVWVSAQRNIYNNGEKLEDGSYRFLRSILTKKRVEKLNEIGFIWKFDKKAKSDIVWNEYYDLLVEYLTNNNGEYPNQSEVYKDKRIGKWISLQRSIYNNGKIEINGSIRYNKHILTQENIDKLNKIGFIWEYASKINYDNIWNKNYELLKEYLEEHNGEYPTQNEEYNGVKIGRWVCLQRFLLLNGEEKEDGSLVNRGNIITKERIDKLNEIKFLWIPYYKKDYSLSITTQKKLELINKKMLCRLKKVLSEIKNEIEGKDDIEEIEKEFVKSLTMFD